MEYIWKTYSYQDIKLMLPVSCSSSLVLSYLLFIIFTQFTKIFLFDKPESNSKFNHLQISYGAPVFSYRSKKLLKIAVYTPPTANCRNYIEGRPLAMTKGRG